MIIVSLLRVPNPRPTEFPPFPSLESAMDAIHHPKTYFDKLRKNDILLLSVDGNKVGYALCTSAKDTVFFKGRLPIITINMSSEISGDEDEEFSELGYAWNTFYLEHTNYIRLTQAMHSMKIDVIPIIQDTMDLLLPLIIMPPDKTSQRLLEQYEYMTRHRSVLDDIAAFYIDATRLVRAQQENRVQDYKDEFLKIIRNRVKLIDLLTAISKLKSFQ